MDQVGLRHDATEQREIRFLLQIIEQQRQWLAKIVFTEIRPRVVVTLFRVFVSW